MFDLVIPELNKNKEVKKENSKKVDDSIKTDIKIQRYVVELFTIKKSTLFNRCLSVNSYIVQEDLDYIYNLSDQNIVLIYKKLVQQSKKNTQNTLPLSHALCIFCILNTNNCAECEYAKHHKPCGDHADSTYALIMKRMTKVKNYDSVSEFWKWFADISNIKHVPQYTTKCTCDNIVYARSCIY